MVFGPCTSPPTGACMCVCVCVCVETEVKLVFCSTEETNVDFREESNSRSINGWTISVVRTALRFSCGKTRKGKKKKRNRDIRLIIRDRDLRPTSRSKSRYCFNPSLSLSFFFSPLFCFSRFASLFRNCAKLEFSKLEGKSWWWFGKRSLYYYVVEEWRIVAEESLIKELIF